MRFKAVKKLIDINIIYTSQASTISRFRQKQAKYPEKKLSVAKNLITTYLFIGLLYAFIFGTQSIFLPLVKHPGQFSNLVSIFCLFIFSQGFLAFYNVFYESKDLQSYRPYAFAESEIMFGKGFSVLLTVLMGIFPIIIYFITLQIQLGQAIWLAVPIVLISLGLLFMTLTFLLLVGVHFITKTAIFRKYKKIVSNILLALATIMGFGAIMIVNMQNAEASLTKDQPTYFLPIKVFHDFSVRPFAPASLLGIGAWLCVAVILLLVIRNKVLPEFYEAAVTTTTTVNSQKRLKILKMSGLGNFPQFVWRYQLNLINDGSVLLQATMMPNIMPYFFLFPVAMFSLRFHNVVAPYLSLRFGLPLILLAVFTASMTTWGVNLTSIGLSLERENFDYLKVLPFDMNRYLRLKFYDLLIIQSIPSLILFIIFNLIVGVQLPSLILMLLVWGLVSLAFSAWSFARDKRLFVSNWSNVTELLNRENSSLKMIYFLLMLIAYAVFVALISYLIYILPSLFGYLLTALSLGVVAVLTIFFTHRFLRKVQED